jgi:hypothetical protein
MLLRGIEMFASPCIPHTAVTQVDRAVAMVELLCHPDDDSLNEHKRLQLRELAALNGTLKDEVACPVCGEWGHRGYECPKQNQELYVLPEAIKAQVEEQYQRDVARVRGADAVASEDDYKTFLKVSAPPTYLSLGICDTCSLELSQPLGKDLQYSIHHDNVLTCVCVLVLMVVMVVVIAMLLCLLQELGGEPPPAHMVQWQSVRFSIWMND